MLKKIALVLALFAISFASLVLNIAIHEAGHYAVAGLFGLQPKMGFEGGAGFIWNNEPIAYTIYIGGTQIQDALISAAGPLANFLVFIFSVLFCRKSKNFNLQLVLLALSIVALLSFVSNIIPSSGSDGEVLVKLL